MDNKDGCTCANDSEDIEPQACPYNEEINNDTETLCQCCTYCVDQCCQDI